MRFYDPLIQIIAEHKEKISNGKLGEQLKLFGLVPDDKIMQEVPKPKEICHHASSHSMQLQRSQYFILEEGNISFCKQQKLNE